MSFSFTNLVNRWNAANAYVNAVHNLPPTYETCQAAKIPELVSDTVTQTQVIMYLLMCNVIAFYFQFIHYEDHKKKDSFIQISKKNHKTHLIVFIANFKLSASD